MAKKEVKKEEKSVERYDVIREHLIKVINEFQKEVLHSFDMKSVIELPGTRGLLRKSLPDLKQEERKTVLQILQDLKKENILYHKNRTYWVRLV